MTSYEDDLIAALMAQKTYLDRYGVALVELMDQTYRVLALTTLRHFPNAATVCYEGEWTEDYYLRVNISEVLDSTNKVVASADTTESTQWDDFTDEMWDSFSLMADLRPQDHEGPGTLDLASILPDEDWT